MIISKFSQIHDNEYTLKAAAVLNQCIWTRCCPFDSGAETYSWWDQDIEAGECYITTDKYGLTDTDFDDHDGEDAPAGP